MNAKVKSIILNCIFFATAVAIIAFGIGSDGRFQDWFYGRGRQAEEIIASYKKAAKSGQLPLPADIPHAIELWRRHPGDEFDLIFIKNVAGENLVFNVLKPIDGVKTNWTFKLFSLSR